MKQLTCSKHCNGINRGKEWAKHGHEGPKARTPESYAKAAMRGPKNPAWKGGVTYWKKHGNYPAIKYVRCPEAFLSMARKDGYIMEHRLLMAKHLGRLLSRTEVVHHKNHDPLDNRIENLELFESNQAHKKTEGTRGEYARSAAV
ncbi:MAG: HNH endonuclease [Syntrophales bacterium]|nr:HNH endonuclease [Syntrophales bacterium]